jgi:hypothetical protein
MVTIAPQIIYKQFRDLAKRRQWSETYLVEQIRGEVDNPTDVIRTIMRGASVDGKFHGIDDTVVAYWPLINLYEQARGRAVWK